MKTLKLEPFETNTVLKDYIPIPRTVAAHKLPSTAILIYGHLLLRATLSQRNGFVDDLGRVYVIYPISELAETFGISDSAVKNNLYILEKNGLIRRVRQQGNKANHIYPYVPEGQNSVPTSDRKLTPGGKKTGHPGARKVAPSKYKEKYNKKIDYNYNQDESL